MKIRFFLGLLVFFAVHKTTAQVATYGFAEALSTYVPLSSGTTIAYDVPWDNHVTGNTYIAPIGFTFTYDGVNHNQCFLNPNGFISFSNQIAPTAYNPLSNAATFIGGGTISALGTNLISTTDPIVYATIGTAPNRTFVVQWTNARRATLPGNFNFQIRLRETTNVIEFSYGVCAPEETSAINAQVGIRGETNVFLQGNVNNRSQAGSNANAPWHTKTANGVANSNTVRTSVTEYPNNGLRYTYTPSAPCVTPTGVPSNLVVGNSNVTATSFTGNSFTAASPAPTNYLILRSTVNTPPTVADVPNRTFYAVNNIINGTYTVISISGNTTFAQTGLTPNTTYYYWVIPYNSGCLGAPFYNLASMLSATRTTCIPAPLNPNATAVGGNEFTANWDAVTGATDYLLDVSLNATFTALVPGYGALSTGGATSIVVNGLEPVKTYYFRVRAVGLSCNYNSVTTTVTTLCGYYTIPYFQNFDTTLVDATPECFTVSDENTDGVQWQTKNSIAASLPNSFHLTTSGPVDSNDWFFLPGLQLTAGVTYRLKFSYTTLSAGLFAENLRVRLGSDPSVTGMNITILDLPNIINTVYQPAIVDFTPVTNSVFHIGFQSYSFSNQSKLMIDDISVIVSPTCFEPTALTITSVGVNSATLSWTASEPEPSNGYDYYVSTVNSIPGSGVTPTGSVAAGITTANLTGLNAATLYYVWVRGNCGPTNQSIWSLVQTFSTDCAAPALLPVVGGSLCGGGSTVLSATAAPGAVIEWYSNASLDDLLGVGETFTTPTLFATTTYYAQSKAPGGLVTAGPLSPVIQGGAQGILSIETFISFSVSAATNFQSVDIYPNVSGQNGLLVLRNSFNVTLATIPFVTSAAGGTTPQLIPIGIDLQPGNYLLYLEDMPTDGLLVNIENAIYPYTSSVASLTGNGYDNTFYLYAYNWRFTNICTSLVTPVTATVTPAPAVSLSEPSTSICKGETTDLVTVSGYGAYDTYVWSPALGVSGSVDVGFTFTPEISTSYQLTLTQTSGSLCTRVVTYSVTVRPEPPAISVIPSNATICETESVLLTASLEAAVPVVIFSENFNGLTNNWTTTNLSTGGNTAAAAWTLRNSIYTYNSTYWNISFSSNDASRFYLSNSDAQGGPGSNRTRTYLESPSFSLVGYTSASLSFWHYLRFIPGNRARVEYSLDNGANWELLQSYTASQGAASSFVNANLNMNSLVGNSSVKIRYYFDATWDYGWAIDNVVITGNLALEVSWTPDTGLYFDAAGTQPYILGTPTGIVYAKPNVTTIYTGTALGANGCFTSSSSTVTVLPLPEVGIMSANQTLCGTDEPEPIEVTGFTGTIIGWEYADDLAFTQNVTPLAVTASQLLPAAIGSFWGDRYFRVVLQAGSCPSIGSTPVLISRPVSIWNGSAWVPEPPNASRTVVFDFVGNYTITSNMQACAVQVISGNISVNSNVTLWVENEVVVAPGHLLFFDNLSSLLQESDVENTGTITYRRFSQPMFKSDYTYWSSPVTGQNIRTFSPLTNIIRYYSYNALIDNWHQLFLATDPSPVHLMVPARGYIVRGPESFNNTTQTIFQGLFTGVPNNGTYTHAVDATGTSDWNLLGNPYPSALDIHAFLLDPLNENVLDATVYLWTHNTPYTNGQYSPNDYATYNFTGATMTGFGTPVAGSNPTVPSRYIASGQGFFIGALQSGVATFSNTMRVAGNNMSFFRTAATTSVTESADAITDLERHRLWLHITNPTTNAFKQALVGYVEGATDGLDRGFDGKTASGANGLNIYTFAATTKLGTQGKALPFVESDVIPLGFSASTAGMYQIGLTHFDGLFDSQTVYLEDLHLQVIHDLKAGPYTFTTPTGTHDNRFVVRFTNQTLGVGDVVVPANSVWVYKEATSLHVSSATTSLSSVELYDVRGRLLAAKNDLNGLTTSFDALELASQVLLVRVTTSDGVVVLRRVVF